MYRVFLGSIIFICLGFIIDINSQVQLPSVISENTILNNNDSFYYSNSSITIPAGITLRINEGVELRMANNTSVVVQGNLICEGTKTNFIYINSIDTVSRWNVISGNYGSIHLIYTHILNAVQFISANHGDIYLNNCLFNSTFDGIGSDCIALHNVDSVVILNCELLGDPTKARIDAIDCDATTKAVFKHNKICNFEDDGIDIGTGASNVVIDSNYIYNCNFGISVGENSKAIANRNIIVACDGALQSHNGAYVKSNHNTFYNNLKGIECHHAGDVNSSGDIDVINSIFSETVNDLYTIQEGSDISIKYSLSDTDPINDDTSNLSGDPLFVDPVNGDFNLLPESPCVNAGNPSEQYDSCCNYIDIGALEAPCSDVDTNCAVPNTLEIIKNVTHVTIFPIPVKDKICIKSDIIINGEILIQIFDINGIKVFSHLLNNLNDCIPVKLNQGSYILQLTGNNNEVLFSNLVIRH